jgi:hypothetical protein
LNTPLNAAGVNDKCSHKANHDANADADANANADADADADINAKYGHLCARLSKKDKRKEMQCKAKS